MPQTTIKAAKRGPLSPEQVAARKASREAGKLAGIEQTIRLFEDLPPAARVRLPTVCALCGCSPATVWRRAAAGTLPAPRREGGTTFWLAGELRRALGEAGQR